MAQQFVLGHDLGGALKVTLPLPAHGHVGLLQDQEGCTPIPGGLYSNTICFPDWGSVASSTVRLLTLISLPALLGKKGTNQAKGSAHPTVSHSPR